MKEAAYNDKISLFERLKNYKEAVKDSKAEEKK